MGVRRSDRRASTYILGQVLVDDLLEVLAARVVVLCGERGVERGRDAVGRVWKGWGKWWEVMGSGGKGVGSGAKWRGVAGSGGTRVGSGGKGCKVGGKWWEGVSTA